MAHTFQITDCALSADQEVRTSSAKNCDDAVRIVRGSAPSDLTGHVRGSSHNGDIVRIERDKVFKTRKNCRFEICPFANRCSEFSR
jgi:hypothetical protein